MSKRDNVIIDLKNVTKEFGDNVVVDNFNLYVRKGEFVTFLGPSGCGKTTTLRMIAGFEIPTKGYIYTSNNNLIGGELTPPAEWVKVPHYQSLSHPLPKHLSRSRTAEQTPAGHFSANNAHLS